MTGHDPSSFIVIGTVTANISFLSPCCVSDADTDHTYGVELATNLAPSPSWLVRRGSLSLTGTRQLLGSPMRRAQGLRVVSHWAECHCRCNGATSSFSRRPSQSALGNQQASRFMAPG